ncbi:MAG: hypothetical protein HYV47_01255 [Candidatus Nealsonbacteria bacterium]|nr:hypothetical protein [Candidatus Nealsonbacteria bacterium]
MRSAIGQIDRCPICKSEFINRDYHPTCSKACWWIWVNAVSHREAPCWLDGCLEVYCGIRTPGYCHECDVFAVRDEIKKRGLDEDTLFGNY